MHIMRLSLLTWHAGAWQTHGEYVLPPIGAGLQPSPSELLDVWQATVCAGAARMEADAVSKPSYCVVYLHFLWMSRQWHLTPATDFCFTYGYMGILI